MLEHALLAIEQPPKTTIYGSTRVNPRMSVGCQEDGARARVLAMSFLGDPFEPRGHPKST